ncbi:MAG: hypothetical protein ACXWWC_05265 [Chitinophagaceae bacterium]
MEEYNEIRRSFLFGVSFVKFHSLQLKYHAFNSVVIHIHSKGEKSPHFDRTNYQMNYIFNSQIFLFGLLSLITVVFSVVDELLPRIIAIIMISKTIPPATHTHGCVYQVLVVVVVVVLVVLELELVLSWA